MPATTYGDINQRTAAWAMTDMLEHARPVCVIAQFGQVKPIPANKSQTVKFRRPVPFAPALTPLTEGVTPATHKVLYQDVSVTLGQYGDIAEITDVVHDVAEDPVLSDATMLSGEQAGATLEQITWGVVRGGTTVFYANGASRSAVNTVISLNRQRKVTRYLKSMKAKKFTKILAPSVNIGTKPIEASYVAVAHTVLEADIRSLPGFKTVAEYGTRSPISEYEIGSVEDCRYVLSPDLGGWPSAGGAPGGTVESTNGTAADVYPIIYLGEEAFGVTPLKNHMVDAKSNMPIKPTVINPNSVDKSDPLGQRGFVGWKAYFAAVRLNETWMARVEVAASSLG